MTVRIRCRCFIAGVGVALGLLAARPATQGFDYVRQNYTKFEYRVPMRDGVKLFTSVYVPRDNARTYPILMTRTPYGIGPYGPDQYPASLGPSDRFTEDGYIFVYQDVRGRMMSDGAFEDMRPIKDVTSGPADTDECTDAYDTIEWLLKNVRGHNGRVGLYGISYPGFYTSAGIIRAHPALKAASPQAPISDWFIGDDFHHNGALYLSHAFNFFSSFGRPRKRPTTTPESRFDFGTSDGYAFYLDIGPMPNVNARYLKGTIEFWNAMMAHERYDSFWEARNIRPHLRDVKAAVLTVGGWFDAEDLFGALETYKNIERSSAGAHNTLVMGPWVHGGWSRTTGDSLGEVRFGAKTSDFYRDSIEFPFFGHYLKDRRDTEPPEAYVFETGANQWRTFDSWPPRNVRARSLYLAAGGRLVLDHPPDDASPTAYDEYASDPADPVPYTTALSPTMTQEHMVGDQRFAARRPDVLSYQSEVLTQDVTVAGPIVPSLHVATSGTDSDFVVKLIDVYPDDRETLSATGAAPRRQPSRLRGYEQLVRGEVFRGKFRNSFEKPEPFVPNVPAKIEYVMPDVFHTFRWGHRIMVQVQSSWFPLVNRNPQTFVDVNTAAEADYHRVIERVYRSKDRPSAVKVHVLERGGVPDHR